jgi:hypothetical protein
MKAFLSVDWDAFVPEDPRHDFGHGENAFFLGPIWETRGRAWKCRTNGLEKSFWSKVAEGRFDRVPTHVSDSHLDVIENPALHDADILVLVDRHHDAYSLPDENVHCGNWVVAWLDQKSSRKVIWVPPPDVLSTVINHREERFTIAPDFSYGALNYTGIHICRSGCWTPPWLDPAFIRFVHASRPHRRIVKTRLDWSDPMKPRWTLANYRSMFACLKTSQTLAARIKAINPDAFIL